MTTRNALKSPTSHPIEDPTMSIDTAPVQPDVVAELRRRITGRVAYPTDSAYPDLVTGHDLAAGHQPAVVVEPVDAADVQSAVAIASEHGLAVAVQATGHGTGVPVRGGMLIATHLLLDVDVDATARTVTAGAGVLWGPLATAVAQHGFMAVTTNGPSVGVVGSTLGGGVGPLARLHGFTADHVESLDVVTPDGFARRLTPGTDLFWALVGGRDGIAVVTAITLRLQPEADLWGGELLWTGPALDEALTWWHELAATVPETVTTSAMAAVAPDADDVPPPLRGRAMLRVTLCASRTDADELERRLASAPPPVVSALAPLTVTDFLTRHGDVAPAMPTWQRGFALADLTAEGLDVVRDLAGPASGAPLVGVEVRRLGGALRHGHDDAVGGRDAEWLVNLVGAPDPALFQDVLPDLARRLESALEPWSTGGSLLNFHGRPRPGHELDRAWPAEVLARLERVRAEIDPRGMLARGGSALRS